MKLENVVVSNNDYALKLIDFAFCERVGQPVTRAKGTEQYMAPEQLMAMFMNKKQPVVRFEATKADMYSLGILLFTLYFGMPPFKLNSPEFPLVQMLGSGNPELNEAFFEAHSMTKVFNKQGMIP